MGKPSKQQSPPIHLKTRGSIDSTSSSSSMSSTESNDTSISIHDAASLKAIVAGTVDLEQQHSHGRQCEGLERCHCPNHVNHLERHGEVKSHKGEHTEIENKHLGLLTKEHHHYHETEEVVRVRERERHVHHVEHHVQPVLDTQHLEAVTVDNKHDVSKVEEYHTNSTEEARKFAAYNVHKNETHQREKERHVIDKGEQVHEVIHHHVHRIVQPIIVRDVHHYNNIRTTIPIHHTVHEAPIVHESKTHEPIRLDEFLKKGGDTKSKFNYDNLGVLSLGNCSYRQYGPADKLLKDLHIGEKHVQPV
ncbi:hypothetical protein MNV49_005760 [Pseudohyphozyma bogoriensis]|nr:hypothetical protein MNV49_005760 [Pseudohyphozyma bogoriensis]